MKKKWAFIVHTIFIWSMYVLMFYVTSFSIDATSELPFSAILIGFIAASFSIAATNGGIGSYPLAVYAAFSIFNVAQAPSLAFGWIMWTSQTLMIIILGGLSLISLPIITKFTQSHRPNNLQIPFFFSYLLNLGFKPITNLMKRLTLFAMFCTTILWAQTQYELIETETLGNRELKIQLPRDYEENQETYYPLILTLDGDYLFEVVGGNTDYVAYWGDMPEAIVVGVNQNKTRADDLFVSDNTFFPINSGAQFFEFISDELIPFFEDNYRVNDFKVAVGHGESANYIQFFAFKNKPVFQAYIALSPSLSPYMTDNLTAFLSDIKTPLFFYTATATEDFRDNRKEILELNTKIEAIESEHLFYAFDNFRRRQSLYLANRAIPKPCNMFLVYQPISRAEYKNNILPLETSPSIT